MANINNEAGSASHLAKAKTISHEDCDQLALQSLMNLFTTKAKEIGLDMSWGKAM
jgi:hypothetical protein